MKINLVLIGFFINSLFSPMIVLADSPYASIDVYYNDKLYPGSEIPKPLLKIGETFKVRFDVTSYQKCYISVKLWTIDKDDFLIINGSSKEIDHYVGQIIEENETVTYEWTVAPTVNWAGGSIPLDFYYQLDELGTGGKIITSGEFTAAYITVSEEYYNEEPAEVSTEPITEESAKAPGFMLTLAIGMLLLAGICRRNT